MSHPITTGWALESTTTAPLLVERVTEAGTLATSDAGQLMVTILTPGWGASGHYSPAVVEAAAAAFPAGTQMHIDHPTQREAAERGVRSVSTLAAVLTEDARWDGSGLVAKARPIGPNGDLVVAAAEAIGVSINAAADFGVGTAEGRTGRIVEAILPHLTNTIDFVTAPGRGGAFTVLESARAEEQATVATYLEARTHTYLSELYADMYGDGRLTRDEWTQLQHAAGEALNTLATAIQALPSLATRDRWADAPTTSPASEAGAAPTNQVREENNGNPTQEEHMPNIEQAELDKLREDAGRTAVLEAEVKTLTDAATKAATEATEARVADADAVVKEAFGDNAPAFIVEAARHAAEAGTFNADEVREAATAKRAHEAGQPAGLGATTVTESKGLPSDEDIANAL